MQLFMIASELAGIACIAVFSPLMVKTAEWRKPSFALK
jgi:hypothetical protein